MTQTQTATDEVLEQIKFVESLRYVVATLETPTAELEETHQYLRRLYAESLADLHAMVKERFPARHAA